MAAELRPLLFLVSHTTGRDAVVSPLYSNRGTLADSRRVLRDVLRLLYLESGFPADQVPRYMELQTALDFLQESHALWQKFVFSAMHGTPTVDHVEAICEAYSQYLSKYTSTRTYLTNVDVPEDRAFDFIVYNPLSMCFGVDGTDAPVQLSQVWRTPTHKLYMVENMTSFENGQLRASYETRRLPLALEARCWILISYCIWALPNSFGIWGLSFEEVAADSNYVKFKGKTLTEILSMDVPQARNNARVFLDSLTEKSPQVLQSFRTDVEKLMVYEEGTNPEVVIKGLLTTFNQHQEKIGELSGLPPDKRGHRIFDDKTRDEMCDELRRRRRERT